MRNLLLALAALSLLAVMPACSSAVANIRDMGRQAVVMEPPRAPHLKGPELREGQVLLAGNYHRALSPEAKGRRSGEVRAPGGVIATHSWDLRFSVAFGGGGPSKRPRTSPTLGTNNPGGGYGNLGSTSA
jgi:hypothetical protein